VSAVKAKLGVFVDTPGERCFLVDETGTVLDHDTAFAVLAQLALSKRTGWCSARRPHRLPSRESPSSSRAGSCRPRSHLARSSAPLSTPTRWWPRTAAAATAGRTSPFPSMRSSPRCGVLELLAQTGASLGVLRDRIPPVAHRAAVEFCPWEGQRPRDADHDGTAHARPRRPHRRGEGVRRKAVGWLVVPDADRPEYHIIASTSTRSSRIAWSPSTRCWCARPWPMAGAAGRGLGRKGRSGIFFSEARA